MARDPRTRRPRQVLLGLVVLLVLLVGGSGAAAAWGGGQWTPKLGLDLEGGTEMVLEPVLTTPGATVNQGQLDKARDIIEQRVNAYGVAEAEVSTQGGRNIVVDIPGARQADPRRDPQAVAAALPRRPRRVGRVAAGRPADPDVVRERGPHGHRDGHAEHDDEAVRDDVGARLTPDSKATSSAANAAVPQALRQDTTSPTGTATTGAVAATGGTSGATATTGATSTANPTLDQPTDTPSTKPTSGSDTAWITPTSSRPSPSSTARSRRPSPAPSTTRPSRSSPARRTARRSTSSARRGRRHRHRRRDLGLPDRRQRAADQRRRGRADLHRDGAKKFGDVTTRLLGLQPPQNQFAIVLDKQVVSAPTTQAAITNGQASITGSFTLDSARDLAQQLKFGALPLSFSLQTQDDVSPTLGNEQLRLGLNRRPRRHAARRPLLALPVPAARPGHRRLARRRVGHHVLHAGPARLVLQLPPDHGGGHRRHRGHRCHRRQLHRLLRAHPRRGARRRPLVAAVEAGWARARRTILAADAVNFLAAIVLYLLAASNVRGFAFTLGVTTIIDLAVVVLFTHRSSPCWPARSSSAAATAGPGSTRSGSARRSATSGAASSPARAAAPRTTPGRPRPAPQARRRRRPWCLRRGEGLTRVQLRPLRQRPLHR